MGMCRKQVLEARQKEEEAGAQLRGLFDEVCAIDKSGGADVVALVALRSQKDLLFERLGLEALSAGKLMKFMDKADKEGDLDGKLDWGEFQNLVTKLRKKCGKIQKCKEDQQDGNKGLSAERERFPAEAAIFTRVDVDQSGGVDLDELCHDEACVQAMRQHLKLPSSVSPEQYVAAMTSAVTQADADGTHYLDWAEFRVMLAQLQREFEVVGNV